MYKSIDELLSLVKNLDETSEAQWGTLTAHRMVEHLIYVFRTSNGKLKVDCVSEEKKLPVLKKILMSDRPMPKNYSTPVNKVLEEDFLFENFETAKIELIKEALDYYNYFDENPEAKPMNPTFGELNKTEWEQFHKKHLTHHLTQFGLIGN